MNNTLKQNVTDFHADLKAATAAEGHPAVLAAIRARFPNSLAVYRAHKENDLLGVDIWIEQKLGVITACDLKIRSIDYGAIRGRALDAVLEISYGNNDGWALKSGRTDAYLFVCLDTGRSAAFKADDLRAALTANLSIWRTQYKPIFTKTSSGRGYIESEAIAVPVDVLAAAIKEGRSL